MPYLDDEQVRHFARNDGTTLADLASNLLEARQENERLRLRVKRLERIGREFDRYTDHPKTCKVYGDATAKCTCKLQKLRNEFWAALSDSEREGVEQP